MPEPMMFPAERETGGYQTEAPVRGSGFLRVESPGYFAEEGSLASPGGVKAGDLEAWAVAETLGPGQGHSGITTGFFLSLAGEWHLAQLAGIGY